jgi:hypothetical protein
MDLCPVTGYPSVPTGKAGAGPSPALGAPTGRQLASVTTAAGLRSSSPNLSIPTDQTTAPTQAGGGPPLAVRHPLVDSTSPGQWTALLYQALEDFRMVIGSQ